MSRGIVLQTKSWSINTTPHKYPRETQIGKWHTTMPITKHKNINCQYLEFKPKNKKYIGHSPKENPKAEASPEAK